MQHPWSCKEHHRLFIANRSAVKWRDVLKVEYITLQEDALDVIVAPAGKCLVERISLSCQCTCKVKWYTYLRALPVAIQQDTELLGTSKCKHGNEHLPTSVYRLNNLL
jgi:hypothetical protein